MNLMIGFAIIHFLQLQIDQTTEWSYDFKTNKMIELINADTQGKPVSIAAFWLFHPSSKYYLETRNLDQISIYNYKKEIITDPLFDYYLIDTIDQVNLDNAYIPWVKEDHYMIMKPR